MVLKRKSNLPKKHNRRRQDFIAAWLRAPLKMGAIVPSSRGLARAMAAQVDADHPGVVIELGAGTGVVTDALLEAGVSPKRLIVIEREPKLCGILAVQFPHLNILCEDAAHLDRVLAKMGHPRVNAIVSSLPMLTLPKTLTKTIQRQMAGLIGEDGIIVQFTFGAKSPLNRNDLRKYSVSGKRVKIVLTNVPPAHVWVYQREVP